MANARDAREAFLAGTTDLQKARRAEIDAIMAEKPASFLGQLGSTGGLLSGGLTLAALLSGEKEAAGELLLGGLAGTAQKVDTLRQKQASDARGAIDAFYQQVEADQKKAAELMKANSSLMIESAATDRELNDALGLPNTFSLKTGYANLREEENRQKAANGILLQMTQGGASVTYDSRKAALSEYYRLMGVAASDESLSRMAERGASMQDLFDAAKNSTSASWEQALDYIILAEQAKPGAMQEQEVLLGAMSLLRRNPTAAELSHARDVDKDAALLDSYTTAAKLMREHGLTWEDALQRLVYVAPDKAGAVRAYDKDASFGMKGWIDANLNYDDIIAATQESVRRRNETLQDLNLPLLDVNEEIAKAIKSAQAAMAGAYSAGATALQGDTYNRAMVVTGDLLGFDPTAGPIDESSSILISQYGEDLMLKAQHFYESLPQEVKDQFEGMVKPDNYVEGTISYGEQVFTRQFLNELSRANMQKMMLDDAVRRELGGPPSQGSVNVGQVMNDILYRLNTADSLTEQAMDAVVAGKMPKEPVDPAVRVDSYQPPEKQGEVAEATPGPLPGMEAFGAAEKAPERQARMEAEQEAAKKAKRDKARVPIEERIDLLSEPAMRVPPTIGIYSKLSPEEIDADVEDRVLYKLAENKAYSGGRDERWLREKAQERIAEAKKDAATLLGRGVPVPRDAAGLGVWLYDRAVGPDRFKGSNPPFTKEGVEKVFQDWRVDTDPARKPSTDYKVMSIDTEPPGDREKRLSFRDDQITALVKAVASRKMREARGGVVDTKKLIAEAKDEVDAAIRRRDVRSYDDAWRMLGL